MLLLVCVFELDLPASHQRSTIPHANLPVTHAPCTPSQVARISDVLAQANINIASLKVARQYTGGGSPALSVIMCDQRIPTDAVAKLASLDGVSNVRAASFGNAFEKVAVAEA